MLHLLVPSVICRYWQLVLSSPSPRACEADVGGPTQRTPAPTPALSQSLAPSADIEYMPITDGHVTKYSGPQWPGLENRKLLTLNFFPGCVTFLRVSSSLVKWTGFHSNGPILCPMPGTSDGHLINYYYIPFKEKGSWSDRWQGTQPGFRSQLLKLA